MTDDRFDDFLRRAARDYNAPAEPPREAMWARIEAARRAQRSRGASGGGRGSGWPRRVWWWAGIGMAAALVLGIGIGLAWRTHASTLATNVATGRPSGSALGNAIVVTQPLAPPIGPGEAQHPSTTQPMVAAAPRTPQGAPRSSGTNTVAPRAYEVATIEHLGRAEALLTAFRAESRSGQVDAQIPSWAGDLLSTTRLLLDSPASKDPRLHKLLSDLEVVLVQIAQLRPQQGNTTDELQLIDHAVEQREMMMRIRATIPAGMSLAGS